MRLIAQHPDRAAFSSLRALIHRPASSSPLHPHRPGFSPPGILVTADARAGADGDVAADHTLASMAVESSERRA
jgi:hypothetical protein